ncbi:MAG: adenylyl-sulfate kinase [Planctomycetota bacterium]|nr:adenylyl-sulfate kinase [Planctomycetota bacterium]
MSENPTSGNTSSNVVWHAGEVPRAQREALLGQRGGTIWFTGLSGSGKSTVAVEVERRLVGSGRLCYRLDGDNLRHGLNGDLGFSESDRAENIRRTGEVCRLLVDTGVIVLASFVSPFRADRDRVRAMHGEAGMPFLEAYVRVPLEVAEARDPKGLYARARAGEIRGFTGIDQPYEPPERPELLVDTSELTVSDAAVRVIEGVRAAGLVSGVA